MNTNLVVSKVIGEGGYGCVHYPPLKCKDKSKDPVNKNMVSKLLTSDNAENELDEASMMSSIDREQYFHISPSSSCLPSSIQTNLDAINKCTKFDTDEIDDYKLLMQENGGINLVEFENEYAHKTPWNGSRITLEKFWLSMSRIMYGLTELNGNNQVHHDLKSQNIVYNEHTGQAKMIDFGLLMEDKDVEVRDLHWSYPPEVELYNSYEYERVIGMNKEEKLDYARSTGTRLLGGLALKYIYYKPVDGELSPFTLKLTQQFLSSILDMDADKKNHSVELYPGLVLYGFDAFMYISLKTFDSYGVGLCCVSMINHTKDHLQNPELADELKNLFMNMVNWNLFNRFTPEQIITTYEGIMQKYGLLEKYDFRFENHKLVKGTIASPEIKDIQTPDPNELKIIEEYPSIPQENDKPNTHVIIPPKPPNELKDYSHKFLGSGIKRNSKKRQNILKRNSKKRQKILKRNSKKRQKILKRNSKKRQKTLN